MKNINGIRLTDRDLQIAKWIAEQQAVRLDTVSQLLSHLGSPCKARNLRRLADRWEKAGLIKKKKFLANAPLILWPTTTAMKLTDLQDKKVEREPSISNLHHTLAVARVRVAYEVMGADWICEGALRSKFGGQHLADGFATLGGQSALIEVERTRKERERLKTILATNARTPGVDLIHYWTTPELQIFLNSQISELDSALRNKIQIYLLPQEVQ
jgi:hypothetical protein